MTALILKQNITKEISKIEDEDFLKAVYTIISNKADEVHFDLNDSIKKELDLRKKNHKNGVSKSYSWQSVKKGCIGPQFMIYKIEIKEEAKQDIILAAEWYANKQQI